MRNQSLKAAIIVCCCSMIPSAFATPFSSGSTGADGAYAPTCSPTPCTVTQPLPANGVFNYTTVTIPAGVTVKYARNAANTPVIVLAAGDVTIAGTLDVSGSAGVNSGFGTVGDRSVPGQGGPGGFDGGRGGAIQVDRRAGNGLGPGGGFGGDANPGCTGCSGRVQGGGGAGYGTAGSNNVLGTLAGNFGTAGAAYGTNLLTPLLGGSGGGGGAGAGATNGSYGTGGGGGGGAILIASSGTVNLTGSVLANGGAGGAIPHVTGSSCDPLATATSGGTGGGGSGGSVRIVAAQFIGNGTMNVNGGPAGNHGTNIACQGGPGARGRTNVQVLSTGTLTLGGVPTLTITSVAGVSAPGIPTGAGDITLPAEAANPATVAISASGVPVGNTVALTITPLRGAAESATSAPLAGSLAGSTTTASINIPQGISTLAASASYTITVAMGEMLRQYADGERVEKVELVATYGAPSHAKLITASGRKFVVPAQVLRTVSIGG